MICVQNEGEYADEIFALHNSIDRAYCLGSLLLPGITFRVTPGLANFLAWGSYCIIRCYTMLLADMYNSK